MSPSHRERRYAYVVVLVLRADFNASVRQLSLRHHHLASSGDRYGGLGKAASRR